MPETTLPPRRVVVGAVVVLALVGWWLMTHAYRPRSPEAGECLAWYEEARTLDDSLAVERRIPGSDTGLAGARTCGTIRQVRGWFQFANTAEDLVGRAIAASGGVDALDSLPAIEWEGSGAVHLPDTTLQILGRWQLLPPDTARVSTWLADQDSSAARTMIVAAPRGWIVRDGGALPMPPELLVEERHQFYLYSLLRLLPLRDPGVTLTLLPNDDAGERGFLVRRPGRLDVALYLGADDRIARMVTRFAVPGDSVGDAQEIRLDGEVDIAGVRWFREMHIIRDGRPHFDLVVSQGRRVRAVERIGIPQ